MELQNNAIDIFKTFSNTDIKRFRDFLDSPFFNKGEKLKLFFNELFKYYPAFNSKHLTPENLSKKITPRLPFNRLTFNSLFHDLSCAAQKYLQIVALEKNCIEKEDLVRRELMNRKLYNMVEKSIRNSQQLQTGNDVNANYYINMFNLYTDLYNLNKINKPKSTSTRIKNLVDILNDRGRYVILFFVTELVRELENIMSVAKAYDVDPDHNFIVNLCDKISLVTILEKVIEEDKDSKYVEIVKTYHSLLLMFYNLNNEKYYYRYKTSVVKNAAMLGVDEKRFHYGRLLRYCLVRTQSKIPDKKFSNELFTIYEYILDTENYKSSIMKYLPVELYRNILKHGLRLRKYAWIVQFIKKYSKLLHPDRRQNMYHFSLAEYFFQRKRFHKARHHLGKIMFEEFIYKVDYRNLVLMTHYELKEYEAALTLIDSYKHFLNNDMTFSAHYKKINREFIHSIYYLILYSASLQKKYLYYIENINAEELPHKIWLTEKIEDIV